MGDVKVTICAMAVGACMVEAAAEEDYSTVQNVNNGVDAKSVHVGWLEPLEICLDIITTSASSTDESLITWRQTTLVHTTVGATPLRSIIYLGIHNIYTCMRRAATLFQMTTLTTL